MTFSHADAGTDEAAWAGSALAGIGELPLGPDELAGMAFILLAAHPDDESLGAGGLLARLSGAGAAVEVLLCSAGEASHPDSPTTTPEQLATEVHQLAHALAVTNEFEQLRRDQRDRFGIIEA